MRCSSTRRNTTNRTRGQLFEPSENLRLNEQVPLRPVTVTATYPLSTLNDTPTRSDVSGTASAETYVAVRRNRDVYLSN